MSSNHGVSAYNNLLLRTISFSFPMYLPEIPYQGSFSKFQNWYWNTELKSSPNLVSTAFCDLNSLISSQYIYWQKFLEIYAVYLKGTRLGKSLFYSSWFTLTAFLFYAASVLCSSLKPCVALISVLLIFEGFNYFIYSDEVVCSVHCSSYWLASFSFYFPAASILCSSLKQCKALISVL